MSDGIESAATNVRITYDLLEDATEKIMNLDSKVQEKTKLFLKLMAEKVKSNRSKGLSLKTGLDDIWVRQDLLN